MGRQNLSTTAATRRRPLLATFFALGGIGIPVLSFLVSGPIVADPALVAIPLLILIISTGRLTAIFFSGETPVLAATMWMFIYITVGVVPLAQFHLNTFPFLVGKEYLLGASVLLLLTAIGYEIGRFLNDSRGARVAPTHHRVVSIGRLKLVSVFAIAASLYYAQTVGGISVLWASRRELRESIDAAGLSSADSQVGSAIVMTAGTVPVFIAMTLWLVHLIRNRSRGIGGWAGLLVLVAVNLVVNNPATSARYWAITILVALVFTLPKLSPNRFAFTIIGGIIGAIVVFPYLDYFREASERRGALQITSIADKIATKDFDQYVMTANGMWWVDERGHTLGWQILGAIFFWVPRSVWPEKARDTGVEIGLAMNTGNINLSSPLPLEMWIDFGWVGVIAGFIVIGYLSRKYDWQFSLSRDPNRREMYVIDILVPLVAGYTFILMRGPLLQSMSRLAVMIAVCVFVMGAKRSIDEAADKIAAAPAQRRGRPRYVSR
ncbi:hypothetical protein [Microbacterium sp. LMI1-1-1.1]|uniref:hypothetical protein n=1 Tax=Microbacterium sp. LMI1-1-1.1 TaxID=3135223 RepID=UPI003465D84E